MKKVSGRALLALRPFRAFGDIVVPDTPLLPGAKPLARLHVVVHRVGVCFGAIIPGQHSPVHFAVDLYRDLFVAFCEWS